MNVLHSSFSQSVLALVIGSLSIQSAMAKSQIIRCQSQASEEGSVSLELKAEADAEGSTIESIRAMLNSKGETGTFSHSISVEKSIAFEGESEGKAVWFSERTYGPRFRQVLVEMPAKTLDLTETQAKTTFIENRSILAREVAIHCKVE